MYQIEQEKIRFKEQYVCWWLGREPSQQDFDILIDHLLNIKASAVRESKNAIDFRFFHGSNCSTHIIIRRKYFGIAINIHIDLGIHSKTCFNKNTLSLLSGIYILLKRVKYGKCFLLPREENKFLKFMCSGKKKWNLI